jgi:hypothetical protein
MANKEEWVTQMYVFPEEGDADYEHDYPYEVQYNPADEGERRTKKLSDEQIQEVRELNGLPNEEVRSDNDE